MAQSFAQSEQLARARPHWLYRSDDEALLTGVCASLARELRTEPLVVRLTFVVLSFAGGLGIVLYVVLWAMASQVQPKPTASQSDNVVWRATVGVLLIAAGMNVVARAYDIWIGGAAAAPLVIACVGSTILWSRTGPTQSSRRAVAIFEQTASPWRVVAGTVMIVAAIATFLVSSVDIAMIGSVLVTLIAVGAGLVLLIGPIVVRLVAANQTANRERIRSDERAEVSAHLHDSVLHTLALIQRSKEASGEVVSLARSQERDLRAWLQGRSTTDATTVQEGVDELASAVEADTGVIVETVVVGEAELNERARVLLAAVKEAAVNAGRHSGAATVSVYVEVEPDLMTAFVRDTGKGFDPNQIDDSRRGIKESIEGRMRRNSGTANITSSAEGTEVELRISLS